MIQATQILKYIQNPYQLTLEDVAALRDLLYQYPYFQTAYTLIAKATYKKGQLSVGPEVQTAAIYATDRNYLRALLEEEPPFVAPVLVEKEAPEAIATPEIPPKKIPTPPSDPYHFINGYINNIRKREARKITKDKSREQIDIIEAFIQKEVQFRPHLLKEVSYEHFQVDLTQESTTFHDDLFTENLAQVLFQQGRVQRAVDIYNKLSLKFPEKRTYFASLAEELKTQV